ncbi:hypothetical protein LINPERHAP2_LOCUS18480 [Linum perenne]
MLQWMGGSRRKVATSRKSIEKRQKQYFEQRRRQQRQQQMGGLESYCEEKKTCEQNQNEHQSLDVLSLLSLSKDSPLCKPANASPRYNHHKHNAEMQCNIPKDAPMTIDDSFSLADSLETLEGRHCSGNQAENALPKKVLFTASENNPDDSGGVEHENNFQETATQKKLSVFDLLDDDDPANVKSRKCPVRESHVAFSVDGLGTVRAETPVQSPQQPDRHGSYDCFTASKSAKQNNYKIHNDLDREVEVMMQDIGLPPNTNRFDFPRTDQLHGKFKNSHTSRDHGQLNSHYMDTTSSYRDKIKPHRETNFDLYDARPTLLDEDFLDEKESNTFWSSLPHGTHDESAHLKIYGSTGLEDYSFEGPYEPRKKRNCFKEVDEYGVSGELDSFGPKYQASNSKYDFLHPRKARKSSMDNVILKPDWSSHVIEDPRGHVTTLSEESCSSTAVRHASMDTSTSYSAERHHQQHENAFDGLDAIYGARSIYAGETHKKNWGNSQKREKIYMYGRSPHRTTLLDPDPGNDFDPLFKENIGHCSDWPYEQGHWSADTNKDFNTLHQGSEMNHPPFVSEPWNEDLSGAFPIRDHHINARNSSMPKYARSVKHSPPNSFISESVPVPEPCSSKRLYDSPTYSHPKVKLPVSPDFQFDGRRTPKLCKGDDFFHGEWSAPNLSSAQESVSKVKGYSKPKRQRPYSRSGEPRGNDENVEALDGSDFGESGSGFLGVKDGGALETSSSVNIPEKSDASIDEVEIAGGHPRREAQVPLSAHWNDNNAEVGSEGFVERKMATRMDKRCLVSSPQVMMVESYVVQLLSVQKRARDVY